MKRKFQKERDTNLFNFITKKYKDRIKKLEDQILNLEKLNDECRQNILELEDIGAKDKRIDSLSEFIYF